MGFYVLVSAYLVRWGTDNPIAWSETRYRPYGLYYKHFRGL